MGRCGDNRDDFADPVRAICGSPAETICRWSRVSRMQSFCHEVVNLLRNLDRNNLHGQDTARGGCRGPARKAAMEATATALLHSGFGELPRFQVQTNDVAVGVLDEGSRWIRAAVQTFVTVFRFLEGFVCGPVFALGEGRLLLHE